MGEALIGLAFIGAIGIGAWFYEGAWLRRERPESISDAQTTSETGLW